MLCEFYTANCDHPLLTGIKYMVDCLSDGSSEAKSDKDKAFTWQNSLIFFVNKLVFELFDLLTKKFDFCI